MKEIKIGADTAKLFIWDIGGHERFQSLQPYYYAGAKGALLVFDLSRLETFDEMEEWYQGLKSAIEHDIPIVLIGNKSDLINNSEISSHIKRFKEFAESLNSIYIQTSAKTGDHIEDAFYEISLKMIEKYK